MAQVRFMNIQVVKCKIKIVEDTPKFWKKYNNTSSIKFYNLCQPCAVYML